MYICMCKKSYEANIGCEPRRTLSDYVDGTCLTLRWPWPWDINNMLVSVPAMLDAGDVQLIKQIMSY